MFGALLGALGGELVGELVRELGDFVPGLGPGVLSGGVFGARRAGGWSPSVREGLAKRRSAVAARRVSSALLCVESSRFSTR